MAELPRLRSLRSRLKPQRSRPHHRQPMHARTLLDSLWPITGWRLWQYRALQAGLLLCGLFLMVTVMSVPLTANRLDAIAPPLITMSRSEPASASRPMCRMVRPPVTST